MNIFLLFVVGLIFLTCLYGLTQTYVSSWLLILGLMFSSFVIGWVFGEGL
jgi:hypothetical protein